MLLLMTTGNDAVGKRQSLGVGENEFDAIGEAGRGDVFASERQHALGGVDGDDANVGHAAAQLDGNLRGAGAQIENSNAALLRFGLVA